MADVYVLAPPILIDLTLSGSGSVIPISPYPGPEVVFNCSSYRDENGIGWGQIDLEIGVGGEKYGVDHISDPIVIDIVQSGERSTVVYHVSEPIELLISLKASPYVELDPREFIWTSRVGYANFTLDEKQQVQKFPVPGAGWVYKLMKLGASVIVYTENGIYRYVRQNGIWGSSKILGIGLMGKNAACGNDSIHYALDKKGKLWKISGEGIQLLDYSNHLSAMGAKTTLIWDERIQGAWITNGTAGFVITASGLGGAPVNITGMGFKAGTFYAAAPEFIVTPPLAVWSDTFDLGNRQDKTIIGLQVGCDTTKVLSGQVAYRWDKSQSFFYSPIVEADKSGDINIMVSGVEFKVGLSLSAYEAIHIDSMSVIISVKDQITGGNS